MDEDQTDGRTKTNGSNGDVDVKNGGPPPANGTSEDVVRRHKSSTSCASTPPDGGWGWAVCCASFCTNAVIFGNLNTFGILYVHIMDEFGAGVDDIAFKSSWIGALQISMTFAMSPVASIFVDRFGLRTTAFSGALVATVGMLASSYVTSLEMLYLTFGVLLGGGSSFVYTPSMVILGQYFRRRIGVVNGLVSFGSAVSTMVLPFLLEMMLARIGLRNTMRVMAVVVSSMMVCSLIWKPLHTARQPELTSSESIADKIGGFMCVVRRFLNVNIWKKRAFVVWAVSVPVAFIGYFVPFVHLVKHTRDVMPAANPEILVMCVGVTSGVSRLVCGKVADIPGVNRVQMQQAAFFFIGIATACIPFARDFSTLVVIVLLMGVCDGCFICLMGPIAVELLGPTGAAQGLGCLFGLMSVPMTIGPPLAGLMYDHLHTYDIAFFVAGIPPVLGACILFLMPKKVKNYTGTNSLVGSMGGVCPSIDNLHTDKSDTTLQIKDVEVSVVAEDMKMPVGIESEESKSGAP